MPIDRLLAAPGSPDVVVVVGGKEVPVLPVPVLGMLEVLVVVARYVEGAETGACVAATAEVDGWMALCPELVALPGTAADERKPVDTAEILEDFVELIAVAVIEVAEAAVPEAAGSDGPAP